jgi:type II secretory pathway component PulF
MTSRSDDKPDAPRSDRISSEDAAELAGRVVGLVRANLPLAPGLRAMAAEMGRGRLAPMLTRIAGRLETGMSLEAAVEAEGERFPPHVGGLIIAGARSGRLAEVLEQLVALRHHRGELRRRVWGALAYPAILLGVVSLLYVLFGLAVIPHFARIFRDFGTELPRLTTLVMGLSDGGVWIFLGVLAACATTLLALGTVPGPPWTRRVLYAIPLLGPLWRWLRLVEFSRLMALLLDEQVCLPEALRLAGRALRTPGLAAGCRSAADHVEAGGSLADCIGRMWQFPASMRPLVAWGQQTSNLAEAFRAAAEVFEGRVRVYTALVESVLPPIVFFVAIASVGVLIVSLFMPMVSIMQYLM